MRQFPRKDPILVVPHSNRNGIGAGPAYSCYLSIAEGQPTRLRQRQRQQLLLLLGQAPRSHGHAQGKSRRQTLRDAGRK
jgi:hypothetical protein